MRNSRRTYKNGKYGVANWENPLTRYNKLYEPFDPMKGQRKKHKKLLKFLSEAFAEREGFEPPEPRSSTVFKTAVIDHSTTSPDLFPRLRECKGK